MTTLNPHEHEILAEPRTNLDKLLPAHEALPEVLETFRNHTFTLLTGETGSGKTTVVPPEIMKSILSENGKMLVTQPRRVAATSVSGYIANTLGVKLGDSVGYHIGGQEESDRCFSESRTKLRFVTDAILLRYIQKVPLLSDFEVVMIDEAHLRGLDTDLCIGLLTHSQKLRSEQGLKPLKIIVSSATLEEEKFKQFFSRNQASEVGSVNISGKMYPVETHFYSDEPVSNKEKVICERASTTVNKIIRSHKSGDILIFQPGEAEIETLIRNLNSSLSEQELSEVVILPLFGRLNREDQNKVFQNFPGKRKIIVSTDIAETSITIDGIKHVIDCGLLKQKVYQTDYNVDTLDTTECSISNSRQRAGRAGRTQPGEYYYLFSERDYNNRPQNQVAEILRCDLSHTILRMKSIGINDIENFDFVESPGPEKIKTTIKYLESIAALDADGNLTKLGRELSELSVEPRRGMMLLEAAKHDFKTFRQIAIIAAFMERNVLPHIRNDSNKEARQRSLKIGGSDIETYLNVYKQYLESGRGRTKYKITKSIDNKSRDTMENWFNYYGVNRKAIEEIEKRINEFSSIYHRVKKNQLKNEQFQSNAEPHSIYELEDVDTEQLAKIIIQASPSSLLVNSYRYEYEPISNGSVRRMIFPGSATFASGSRYIIALGTHGSNGKVNAINCMPFKEKWLEWIPSIAPSLIEKIDRKRYFDSKQDRAVQEVAVNLINDHGLITTEFRALEDQVQKIELFSEYLVSHIPIDICRANQAKINDFKKLINRCGNMPPQPYADRLQSFSLKQFYMDRLEIITNMTELNLALDTGSVNIEIDEDYLLPQHLESEILTNYPESIQIGDETYPIIYQQGRLPQVTIQTDRVIALFNQPKLPGGSEIELLIHNPNSSYIVGRATQLELAKQIARDGMVDQLWHAAHNKWLLQPQEELINDITTYELPDVLPTVKYGEDPLTHEDLVGYCSYVIKKQYDNQYKLIISFEKTKEKSEEITLKSILDLEDIKNHLREVADKEELTKRAYELLETLSQDIDLLVQNAHDFFISEYELSKRLTSIFTIKSTISSDPRRGIEMINENKNIIDDIKQKAEKIKLCQEKAKDAIDKFANCPLCGQAIEVVDGVGVCSNHNQDQMDAIDFRDDYDTFTLSELLTNDGDLLAKMECDGDFYHDYSDAKIKIRTYQTLYGWRGEPFESTRIENFGRIKQNNIINTTGPAEDGMSTKTMAEMLAERFNK